MKESASSRVRRASFIGAFLVAACSGGDGGSGPPTGPSGGSISIALSPTSLNMSPGGSATLTITLTRSGAFDGAVTVTVQNAPAGVTASPSPATIAAGATSVTLTIQAAANAAAGNATLSVRASGDGVNEATAALALVVASPPPAVSGEWRICGFESPLWFAIQDGSGPWTRIVPSNNAIALNLPSGRGGVAYVEPDEGGGFVTTIFFGTAAELGAQGETRCAFAKLGPKTIQGSVAGVGGNEIAWIAMGGSLAVALPAAGNAFAMNRVFDGPVDLIAARIEQSVSGSTVSFTPRRLIIRRNLNPPNGSTLPVLDFSAAEAFDPAAHTVTVANLNGDQAFSSTWYHTVNGFVNNFFASGAVTAAASLPWYGIPADRQASADLHALAVSATPASPTPTTTRTVIQYFRQAADRTATFGPNLSSPTVTTVATAPAVRLRAQFAIQPEYDRIFSAAFSQGSNALARAVSMQMTVAYLGAVQTADLAIPDFSAAADWNPNWGLGQAVTTWSTAGMSWTAPGGAEIPVVDGAVVRSASRSGQVAP